ncbi:uncharacterized protein LOC120903833 isoform X4 [Anopheles arabiensis]|uniref:uncharacterized protein LOC120903833 isoform X4 n=1 Tax=Anopheles arabiensis TaxID=7173 RepID=UPI001AAD2E5D|nr:uncharacterized protein LOC120903833 isoform X4 [Anopheles arabiensis]
MLGPTKWRLLTIVAGILLAHAIESPTSKGNKLNAQVRSFTNPELGLRIEQISPWSTGRNIPARNLLVPHQLFSRVDNIRYIDSRTPNSRHLQSTFGAFRIADQQQTPSSDGLQRRRSKAIQMRRSDEAGVDAGLPLEQQPGASVLPSPEQEPIYQNVSRSQRQHRYKIIPISYFYREEAQPVLPANLKPVGPSRPPKETENDEPEVPDTSSKQAQEQEHAQGGDEYARSDTPVIGARRSGIQFPGPLKAANGFTPQGYSEESLTLGDNLGIFQQPVSTADDYGPVDGEAGHDGRGTEEFSRSLYANRYFRDFNRPPIDLRPAESLPRPSRLIEFPGSVNVKQPFRDDVTKFGDVAGPVTAVQRPFGEFGGDGQKNFRAFDPTYYTDSPYQPNRPAYFPAKLYTEPNQKIYQPLWKTRSPRVVFPQAQDLASGPSGFGVDNVVFRDQNFGLNELAAIQDVRNEFNQDDINDEPATTSKDRGCGISLAKQTAQRRIVGGDDAGFGSFPWQAYIRIGSSRCGGSLISRRHVVTAGHCVARATPRQVHVTLGDYVINSAVEPLPAYTFGVRTINVHPYFKFTPQADRFDVAVLTLERTVHFMPHIAPICLPEKNEDFLGKFGWAAGWGALNPGSRLRPKTLQAVDVPVLDNRVCERWHRSNGINVVIYPEMLCAGYRGGGKDSCQGDSGGPLMHEKTGRWYLIGIVSAGYSCATRGQPGIYHRVANTVDWISHITQIST